MIRSLFKHRRLAIGTAISSLILGIVLWRSPGAAQSEQPRASAAIPVKVAAVERRDVARSVSGVGNVQSLHTIVMKPQVSGVVTDILFKEGQLVRGGEVLARIDDRAIVASLQQAEAQKARNVALLEAAELDLK